ncbi:hypothetical protein C7A17_00160 [Ectopseudomonas mendocina]|uniref:Uncharacterized protein n=1 Tax=Ectopseudomonas mendocina TaxID=300 RepID=A0A2R3QHM0_ECTME|nr:hypothetical protein C7A17_00160 [Pseudomonas mendocina]
MPLSTQLFGKSCELSINTGAFWTSRYVRTLNCVEVIRQFTKYPLSSQIILVEKQLAKECLKASHLLIVIRPFSGARGKSHFFIMSYVGSHVLNEYSQPASTLVVAINCLAAMMLNLPLMLDLRNPDCGQYRSNRANRLHPSGSDNSSIHSQHQDVGAREDSDNTRDCDRQTLPHPMPDTLVPHPYNLAELEHERSMPALCHHVQQVAA